MKHLFAFLLSLLTLITLSAKADIKSQVAEIESKVVKWRHHLHQNPELSNREFKTAEMVATHLKSLGLQVEEKVAYTGVVGLLNSGKPGPTIALRADMDALPVKETSGVPFASKAIGEYNGQPVPVMHACGHDTHVAMLMGAAELLANNKEAFTGKVVFLFQPAEEGAPKGEGGGAEMMIAEGALSKHGVDAVFGIHINSVDELGHIGYRSKGIMASVDDFKITIEGKQVHGAYPWKGIDPIVTAAQLINQIQTIVSREAMLIEAGAVVTIGAINGGIRSNIIPEKVEMLGTIRALDKQMREKIHAGMHRRVRGMAEATQTTIKLELPYSASYPVTYNDEKLTKAVIPILERAAGEENVFVRRAVTGAEDFSFFQQQVPGVYVFLGGRDPKLAKADAPAHHTPEFRVEDAAMKTGVELFYRWVTEFPQDAI
jgi:amidohydrolase